MRWMMLGLGTVALLAAPAVQAEEAGFKDWWAVCDNIRYCSAYGFASEGAEAMGLVRIERGAAPADEPRVSLGTLGATAKAWRAEIDGKPIRGDATIALEATEDADIEVTTLGAAQGAAILDGIRNGRTLVLVGDGKPGPTISLAGSTAALRWIDDRQKRADTPSALVAKGSKPMNAQPPVAPLVSPAAEADQSNLPKRLPASVATLRGECEPDLQAEDSPSWDVHRLAPGRLLWILPCSSGAYNITARLITADEQGGAAREEQVAYGDEQISSLMNLFYDPKTRVLTSFEKGRGLGDCGAVNEWTWTGQRFERSRSTLMTECRGAVSDLWPTVFVSRDR